MSSASSPCGSLFVVSAPSGAGKSSLVNALLAQDSAIGLSISYTTRPPRPGEQHGREYYFTTIADFQARSKAGEFLESAEVHGNYYGTSRVAIAEKMHAGNDVLLEIDWQGARQIKIIFPDSIGTFILHPSISALEERLKKRGQDGENVIAQRLLGAGGEIARAPEFDYVIINDDFNFALSQLAAIVKASRCRFAQQSARYAELFAQLGIHHGAKQ
jgi:guanylate kinase